MNAWRKYLSWRNRNNQDFIDQIKENRKIGAVEAIGYLLQVAALVDLLLYVAVPFKEAWIGWVFLAAGLLLGAVGKHRSI
ncbi:MAG: hypothetical protein ACRESE_09595 [Gammaproteobacteria bacterium]